MCMCSGIFVHLGVVTLQITSVVGPNRDRLDACLVFPSMPAVMKLNKLGTFSMAQLGQSKSIIGDFIKSARKVRVVWNSKAPSLAWLLHSFINWRARPACPGQGELCFATAGHNVCMYLVLPGHKA